MMLELRYKKYAEDFTRINNFQLQYRLIAKKDVQIVYRLFKLFCLKDRVFSAFIKRPKETEPVSLEKTEKGERTITNTMDIESDVILPSYTDTEIVMDDMSISITEFITRFEKIKVDEVSIDEAEDDICFNAKDIFDESKVVSLIGLKYT